MKSLLNKTVRSPHFLMIIGSNFAAMLNFIANVLMTRNLAPDEAAKFFAIAAVPPLVYSIFSFVPYKVAAVVMAESQQVKDAKETSAIFYKHLITTLVWTLILIALSVPLKILLNLEDSVLLASLFLVLFFTAQVNFISGIFQGRENFFLLALKDISISAVKIIALFILFYLLQIRNAWTPLFAEATAIFLTLAWCYYRGLSQLLPLSEVKSHVFTKRAIVGFFSSSLTVIGGVAFIGFVTSYDILLAKNFLPATDAGYLIAASTFSKIVFFTCGSVPTVVYLLATKYKLQNDKQQNVKSLLFSFSLVLAIGGAVAMLLAIGREFLVAKMYGASYGQTQNLVPPMLAYMLLTSLSILLINFLMAQHWIKPLWISVFAYGIFTIYTALAGIEGAAQLASNMAGFSLVILLILSVSTLAFFRRK